MPIIAVKQVLRGHISLTALHDAAGLCLQEAYQSQALAVRGNG